MKTKEVRISTDISLFYETKKSIFTRCIININKYKKNKGQKNSEITIKLSLTRTRKTMTAYLRFLKDHFSTGPEHIQRFVIRTPSSTNWCSQPNQTRCCILEGKENCNTFES